MRVAICTVKQITRVSIPRKAPCGQAVDLLPSDLEG
jgi:hypothetical protein